MRGSALLLAALLAVPLFAGCSGPKDAAPARAVTPADVGFDPTAIRVTGTRLVNATIRSWDGATDLAAVVRVPLTSDRLPDGTAPRWPVVLFLHGWGEGKESFTGGHGGVPGSGAAGAAPLGRDRLEEFARQGFVAVAYDARGFGQSGGAADVAGPATMADLDSVLDWVAAHAPTSGRVGIVGASYGAGQAYLAWARDLRVTTAVPMYGWVDLGGALLPNDVPKLEWAQVLYGYGLAGSRARYDPMIHDWYAQLYQRTELDRVRAQMAERSALLFLDDVQKPLLVCQGLQETLFPQADAAWEAAAGFTRAYVHTGGHGSSDEGCWRRALDWMQFFLAGFDTRVDSWPRVETVDAGGAAGGAYDALPATAPRTLYLRSPDLTAAPAPGATFTVRQAPGHPGTDPSGLSDLLGGARPAIPDALRTDPTATAFTSPPLEADSLLVGAPALRLRLHSGQPPFQVAALLLRLQPDGTSQVLGHAAFAALDAEAAAGDLEMRFEWTHALLEAGERIQLKVAANDAGFWMPLLADYEVTFDGMSSLELPIA